MIGNTRKTRIIELGLTDEAVSRLENQALEVYRGSYGEKLDCRRFNDYIHFNYDLPDNIQEYDVLVLSFDIDKTINNTPTQESRLSSQDSSVYFYCKYPVTLFNPIPYVSSFAISSFAKKKKPFLRFIFVPEAINDKTPYYYCERTTKETHYESFDVDARAVFLCGSIKKTGSVIKISEKAPISIRTILNKYLNSFKYYRILYVDSDSNVPILENDDGEIVGFIRSSEIGISVILPEMIDPDAKGSLIFDLIHNYFSILLPQVFSGLINKKWINDEQFKCKQEKELEKEICLLEKKFEENKNTIQEKISEVRKERQFLYNLLTSDSELLVSCVVTYLKKIGFESVENSDEKKEKKEEDIAVLEKQRLLLIEVKGISSLPQERDCNQIDKVVHRKQTEYEGVIHSAFIVNYEKNISPLSRSKQVFTKNEIEDSINFNRSLITTWDMYKAFERVESGFLSRKYVRDCFWKDGLVCFDYPEEYEIGSISRIYKNGIVGVISVSDLGIKVGEKVICIKDDNWSEKTVKRIIIDNHDYSEIKNKEVSVEFDSPVSISGRIYARLSKERENDND